MQLSKFEEKAYRELKKSNFAVFKVRDLSAVLSINKTQAYNLVKALKKKGVIKSVKGFLVLNDADEFIVGSSINWPSYVSFWSALNYYGFSDQTPKKIFLATTKYTKDSENFKYVTISKKRFFGYQKIGNIIIADKEKAIIDCLLFPKYAGGIKEVFMSLKSKPKEFDIERLADYALKVGSKGVLRRLGFILESLRYKDKNLKKILKKLEKNIGKGYELLDSTLPKKNNLNIKWLLDINW